MNGESDESHFFWCEKISWQNDGGGGGIIEI